MKNKKVKNVFKEIHVSKNNNCYDTSYTDFHKSQFIKNKKQAFIRIEIMGDFPSDEVVKEYLDKEFKRKIKEYTINSIYHDPAWLTDWNVGNPNGPCFGLIIVFLTKN